MRVRPQMLEEGPMPPGWLAEARRASVRKRWPWWLWWVFAFRQTQYPNHQLGVQQGARGNTQLSATWWGVPGKSDHPDTGAALPQTWRKLWQAHSVQGWGAWGRSGKAGSSEGPAPIISRHQACCLSGGLRSRGCRPCSDTHSVTTLAISGRQASSKDSLSPLHLGHDSRKLDRRPPGLSSSCFQGDA